MDSSKTSNRSRRWDSVRQYLTLTCYGDLGTSSRYLINQLIDGAFHGPGVDIESRRKASGIQLPFERQALVRPAYFL